MRKPRLSSVLTRRRGSGRKSKRRCVPRSRRSAALTKKRANAWKTKRVVALSKKPSDSPLNSPGAPPKKKYDAGRKKNNAGASKERLAVAPPKKRKGKLKKMRNYGPNRKVVNAKKLSGDNKPNWKPAFAAKSKQNCGPRNASVQPNWIRSTTPNSHVAAPNGSAAVKSQNSTRSVFPSRKIRS